ncbi:hypothetical protein K2X85_08010 [bacterium]|nr:hypothetical protein [bacterium]
MSQLPSYQIRQTLVPREVLYASEGIITGPIVLDGDRGIDGRSPTQSSDIRAGWLLGRINANSRWVPCKRTRVSNANGTGTSFIVVNASPFRVGDVITVGNDANLTISAINYSTNSITVSTSFTWADAEAVFAQDGSGTCRGVLLDNARLRNADNTAPSAKGGTLLVQGLVRSDMILGDLTAIRADTGSRLAGVLFTDEQGLA